MDPRTKISNYQTTLATIRMRIDTLFPAYQGRLQLWPNQQVHPGSEFQANWRKKKPGCGESPYYSWCYWLQAWQRSPGSGCTPCPTIWDSCQSPCFASR